MKATYKIIFGTFLIILNSAAIFGQAIGGSINIPSGGYPTIASAIAQLNTNGVAAAGVTFTVASGYTETASNLVLTASGTSGGKIIFQSGGSPNPVITATVGTGAMDGIIVLSGSDYVTFDGIDLKESASNFSTTTQMEWGYALLKSSATNGAQNVTITNCKISLNSSNLNSVGIYSNNHTSLSTTALTVTSSNGTNSNNLFIGNTITNVAMGVNVIGFNDPSSPYSYYDQGNQIGQAGKNRNNISCSLAQSATPCIGISVDYQNDLKIANDSIFAFASYPNGGFPVGNSAMGIVANNGSNSSLEIYNNIIVLQSATLYYPSYGIRDIAMGSNGTTNTVNIHDNTIKDITFPAASLSGTLWCIENQASCRDLIISNNTVKNIINNVGAASNCGVRNTGAISNTLSISGNLFTNNTFRISVTSGFISNSCASSGTCSINNNTISDNTISFVNPGASIGIFTYFTIAGAANNLVYANTLNNNTATDPVNMRVISISNTLTTSIYQNTISNITTSAGYIYGVNVMGGASVNANNNTIFGLNTDIGAAYGVNVTGGTSVSIDQNTINTLSSTTGALSGINVSAGTTVNVSGNTINALNSTGGGLVAGSSITAGITINTFNNKIYDLISRTTSGTAYGISVTGGTTNLIYNNMVSDLRTPDAVNVNAVNGLYLNGGTTLKAYYNSIYLSDQTSSTGATFGTSGVYTSTTPTTIIMQNNIVVNKSIASGTGLIVAHRRNSNSVANLTSNVNGYWSSGVIGYDGATSYSFATYKSTMVPNENTIAGNGNTTINVDPGFTNLADLHQADMSSPNVIQLKGTPIAGISSDIDAQGRNSTTPDLGYDEVNSIILPIQLVSFTGTAVGADNLLEWSTATETNNDYFTLERSIDGINFSLLTTVNSLATNGNSTVQLNYNYTDVLNNSLPATLYYRLKQTDLNGNSSGYSNIVSITHLETGIQEQNNVQLANIYPNPATDNFNIAISSTEETQIDINIIDVLGRTVASLKNVVVNVGLNQQTMNVSTFTKGYYFIQINTLNGTAKVQKQLIVK